ncbi:hypothetical protein [Catenulispora yoronensis]|uniref:hypothetical protein n=1 Tax=Catenulispora yoronensis TaxID=450799 RepID=UPI0031D19186
MARDVAAERFGFLAGRVRGRRNAVKDFTHAAPEFVFWIFPEGALFDAKDAHRKNVPRGYEYILDDEPDYGGFLRGRLARSVDGFQLVVVYCRSEALIAAGRPLSQLLTGLRQLPVPLDQDALVISDNGDLYGTVEDLMVRETGV